MEWFLVIVVTAIIAGLLLGQAQHNAIAQKAQQVGADEKIPMGKYVAGLPSADTPATDIWCAFTPHYFVFITSLKGELGRIPKDSINSITLSDRSQVTQRLTVTRMLTLGVFSLAAPKKSKHPDFFVVFDWDDDSGERQNTVFEFTGLLSHEQALKATNSLNQAKQQKRQRLKADEKTCPFCAETIKKDARICRFCNRDLPSLPHSSPALAQHSHPEQTPSHTLSQPPRIQFNGPQPQTNAATSAMSEERRSRKPRPLPTAKQHEPTASPAKKPFGPRLLAVADFSRRTGVDEEEVINRIRQGLYSGRFTDGRWYVDARNLES